MSSVGKTIKLAEHFGIGPFRRRVPLRNPAAAPVDIIGTPDPIISKKVKLKELFSSIPLLNLDGDIISLKMKTGQGKESLHTPPSNGEFNYYDDQLRKPKSFPYRAATANMYGAHHLCSYMLSFSFNRDNTRYHIECGISTNEPDEFWHVSPDYLKHTVSRPMTPAEMQMAMNTIRAELPQDQQIQFKVYLDKLQASADKAQQAAPAPSP